VQQGLIMGFCSRSNYRCWTMLR